MNLRKRPDIGLERAEPHDSEGHETAECGYDSHRTRTKNDCAGKGQQQFTRPTVHERRN
jgi:hypothetical protein